MGKSVISCLVLWICTAITGIIYYFERNQYITQATDHIISLSVTRRHEINSYFNKHEKNITDLRNNTDLIGAVQKLTELQKADKLQTTIASTIAQNLRKLFSRMPQAVEYDHIFLVSVSGKLLFSLKPAVQHAAQAENSNPDDTLTQSYRRIVMGLAPDVFYTSYYPPTQRAALFFSMPIFDKQALIGIVTVQLDDQKLFATATNTTGLGKTGESVLGKKDGQDLIYVSKVRHQRGSRNLTGEVLPVEHVQGRIVPIGSWSEVLGQAVLGNTQFLGITQDYRGKKVVAAGSYIPYPDWGMVTKKDLDEVLDPLLLLHLIFYVLLLASLLTGVTLVLIVLQSYFSLDRSLLLIALSCICSCILLGIIINRYRVTNNFVIDHAVASGEMQINNAIFTINQKMIQAKHVAQAIAAELGESAKSSEDIAIRIKRDLAENPDFVAITVAFDPATRPDKKLYAPTVARKNEQIETAQLEKFYDYTIVYPKDPRRTAWYLKTVNKRPSWTDFYTDPISNKKTIVYAVPFISKAGRGVVAIMYNLESIQNNIKSLSVGKGSYGVLFNNAHELLYYPVPESVGKTVESVGQKSFTHEMNMVLKRVAEEPHGNYQYWSKSERLVSWILHNNIQQMKWTIALIFNEDDIIFPIKKLFNYKIYIILCMILVAICFAIFILYRWHFKLYAYSMAISAILALGLIGVWILIDRNLAKSPNQLASITDRVSLNEFIKAVNQDALLAHKHIPETLKTGIFVDYLQLTKSFNILLSGRVWQKVPLKIKERLPAGIKFPQSLNAEIKELYRKTEGDYEIVSWQVKCEIYQVVDYTKYPFDLSNLSIQLEYPDVTKNVLLVPDLSYYPTLVPQLLPGLSPAFQVSGFLVVQSFFNYEYVEKKVVVDRNRETQTKQPVMTFNIILRRGLINTLIMYLLPLFIILVSVFAVLWMVEGMPNEERSKSAVRFRFLSIFTAIFFALILLHRNLRGEFQSGEIGYIDYFFFFTYFTILVMMLYVIIRPRAIKIELFGSRSSAVQLLYWPVEFLFWIVVTVVIFYNY